MITASDAPTLRVFNKQFALDDAANDEDTAVIGPEADAAAIVYC